MTPERLSKELGSKIYYSKPLLFVAASPAAGYYYEVNRMGLLLGAHGWAHTGGYVVKAKLFRGTASCAIALFSVAGCLPLQGGLEKPEEGRSFASFSNADSPLVSPPQTEMGQLLGQIKDEAYAGGIVRLLNLDGKSTSAEISKSGYFEAKIERIGAFWIVFKKPLENADEVLLYFKEVPDSQSIRYTPTLEAGDFENLSQVLAFDLGKIDLESSGGFAFSEFSPLPLGSLEETPEPFFDSLGLRVVELTMTQGSQLTVSVEFNRELRESAALQQIKVFGRNGKQLSGQKRVEGTLFTFNAPRSSSNFADLNIDFGSVRTRGNAPAFAALPRFTSHSSQNPASLDTGGGSSSSEVAAAAQMLKDIFSGSTSSSPSEFVNMAGTLFFMADDATNGKELWKSDGTASGTELVKDINPGTSDSSPSQLTNLAGTLLFRADDGTDGAELWTSDGTEGGTVQVKDIRTGAPSGFPHKFEVVGSTLFFQASNGTDGVELWKSDGTTGGTEQVKDINPSGSSSPAILTNVNGTLFFQAVDGTNGAELWKSDGTSGGTVLVKNVLAGDNTSSSFPNSFFDFNGTLIFQASGADGAELWESDGTTIGTVVLKDINPSGSSFPGNFTQIGTNFYFSASDGTNGSELWKSDGTTGGTAQLVNINPAAASSSPSNFININSTLFFSADDGTNGKELWSSDGTAIGTSMVKDVNSGASDSSPDNLTEVDGALYFTADDGTNGEELWESDGTEGNTSLVEDINDSGASAPTNLINIAGTLFFAATDGLLGVELWIHKP